MRPARLPPSTNADASCMVMDVRAWLAVVVAWGAGACVGGRDYAALYEPCVSMRDCTGAADGCFEVVWEGGRGAFCSTWCEEDRDCAGAGRCFELAGDPRGLRICYQNCTYDALVCSRGFECVEARTGETPVGYICMPR
ncbi:MAG: hypothetical protein NZ898_14860 [Myxococcota bacterium]|nr:hypothetical protein [Myxococcota bacterium]MDW8361130.1 hypothetical protein [Myxococcales bacterium]